MLGMMFQSITRAAASIKRINEILDAATVIDNGTKELEDVKGYVSFNNVTFRYPNAEEPLLKNINLKINQGETVAFIGSTGSAKSTIVFSSNTNAQTVMQVRVTAYTPYISLFIKDVSGNNICEVFFERRA